MGVERTINVDRQETSNSELEYCSSTQELFECKKLKSPLFKRLYSGKLTDFFDRQKYLLDIQRENVSETKYCEDNKITQYLFKKVLEEYGITSYKKPSKLVNLVYENVVDLEEDTFLNKQINFIEILDKYDSAEELSNDFKLSLIQIYKYGIIFGVNILEFYKNKNSGKDDYKNPFSERAKKYHTKPNKVTNNEENKGENFMKIPNEVVEAVESMKNNVVEEKKESSKKATKKKTKKEKVTVNNDSKQNDVELVDHAADEVNKEISLTDRLQAVREEVLRTVPKDEFTETQIENYVRIKQLDVVIGQIIDEDYEFNNNLGTLKVNKEFMYIRSKISLFDQELANYFTRKMFNNYLSHNIERKHLVYENNELTTLSGVANILNSFRKFETEFYKESSDPIGEDDILLEKAVKEFTDLSNILTYEKTLNVVKKFYINDKRFNKIRKVNSDDENYRVKSYVQNYLRLWDRTCDENGNKIPYNQRKNFSKDINHQEEHESADVKEKTLNKELQNEQKELVKKKNEESVQNQVKTEVENTEEVNIPKKKVEKKSSSVSNKFTINNKEDLDKLYGLIQGMLMTGNHFNFEVNG